jgi:hypothetical protein
MDNKICSKCSISKSLDNFRLRNDTKKHRNECMHCQKQLHKDYVIRTNYHSNEQRLKIKRENNSKEIKHCNICNENKSLDKFQFRSDSKTYRNQCKECRNKYVCELKKQEKHKRKQNERAQERRRIDPAYLMNQRLRARLRKILISKNTKKTTTMYDLLGCSVHEFKIYIERQFIGDMCWTLRNFELDHKIPCAFFDLTLIDDQRKCFHYTNFQPLKPEDNSKKSNNILEEHMEYLFSIMF